MDDPSFSSLALKAVQQAFQLLLTQVCFIFQLALLDDEHQLHLDEVLLVHQTFGAQVTGQDVKDDALPVVQVLLKLPGILMLLYQDAASGALIAGETEDAQDFCVPGRGSQCLPQPAQGSTRIHPHTRYPDTHPQEATSIHAPPPQSPPQKAPRYTLRNTRAICGLKKSKTWRCSQLVKDYKGAGAEVGAGGCVRPGRFPDNTADGAKWTKISAFNEVS